MSRRSSLCLRLYAALIAVALVVAAPAKAEAVIGGQLFATGGTVDIVVQPRTATVHQPALPAAPGRDPQQHRPQHGGGQACDGWAFPCGQGARVRDHRAQRRPHVLHGSSEPEPGRHRTRRGHGDRRAHVPGRLRGPAPAAAIGTTTTTSFSSPATSRRTGLLADEELTYPDANAKSKMRPLTIREARRRLPRVLRKQYGRRFTRRRGPLRKSCYRRSTEKVRCRVRWNTRRHRYSGNATMWKAQDDLNSIVFTTSIHRTRRATSTVRAR